MSTDDAQESVKAGSKYPDARQSEAQILTGSGTDTLLQTDALLKSFGGFHAVETVDFAVEAGEMHCLIGPNGAGKSTLMKLITGTHDATSGRIFYDGQEITDLEPHERIRRGISIKFQVPSVYEELSVRENVRLPIQRFLSGADREARIEETLDIVGLADRADDLVGDLAHGQQQQLEIGMAASLDPDLLLLDEPVAGLSMEERDEIADRIQTLNTERGIAFVVIEHDTDFVAKIADEVTVLHQGQIFREGPIEEIRDDPEVRRIYLGGESDA
ncbi:ABC transporter ATP-binding protein [Halococcoides cellulosivorans]|uniref:ABC transporter ATP-binding protein n=1 Tax=Halococcoides cellulosivorans TaxID=1679096 RepID=A0A2R4X0E0_9EURY|nr:ABC transporter ATP-binding protein [Halococcoides cellulosivorans]AWB27231.1 ABC transporter ATP-binding protein [Halococcoides cellulosivorans]